MPHASLNVPMREIGPILIHSKEIAGEIKVPMATFETTLWPSTQRGAKLSRLAGGINATVIRDHMTRSILLEAPDAQTAYRISQVLDPDALQQVVATTSRFTKLTAIHPTQIGNLLYLRFAMTTGDAAGHNMVTKASDALIAFLTERHAELRYVSVSGNICTDKKVSSVNALLGRGKHVIAEIKISRELCQRHLRVSPEMLVDLHIKKNLLGSIAAGSLHSANAHVANMLLAVFLATGQDAANIVEGSQSIVHAEVQNNTLYFSVSLPNIIVGTVGNGKHLPTVTENLTKLGCLAERTSGDNARRLAIITAATVLCTELSLLAALSNRGELTRSHMIFERNQVEEIR